MFDYFHFLYAVNIIMARNEDMQKQMDLLTSELDDTLEELTRAKKIHAPLDFDPFDFEGELYPVDKIPDGAKSVDEFEGNLN